MEKKVLTAVPAAADKKESSLHADVLRTLLYYDIWEYPLTGSELFNFLPRNSLDLDDFREVLSASGPGENIRTFEDYYFLRTRDRGIVASRRNKEENATRLWRMARLAMHVIKRFPFVRAVFVSGDLSKNATTPQSDVDFCLITAPGRLWIARTLLILFKKIFLLNRKKYFCLNYFVTEDRLLLDERNIFVATEIAHLKPLYNTPLFSRYLEANSWIRKYFPNYDTRHLRFPRASNRPSYLQRALEFIFLLLPADRIDHWIMIRMQRLWRKRYPDVDEETRNTIFRSTRSESRAYAGNYQKRILDLYREKLSTFGL